MLRGIGLWLLGVPITLMLLLLLSPVILVAAVSVKLTSPGPAFYTQTRLGRFGARSRVRAGDTPEIAVDTRALHFFDPETGRGIYADPQTKGA